MSQYFQIHPDSPQPRLLNQAVSMIQAGGVVVYPTDSLYALGCQIGDKNAMHRIRRLRDLDERHNFTLVCRDLSELAKFARVDNTVFRLLKAHTPGAYTFILPASREVPRRLQHPKRKTIGLRVPDSKVAQSLLERLGEPLMSTTLQLHDESEPLTDPMTIKSVLAGRVDLIIDGGHCGQLPSTVIDLTGDVPVLVRQGLGDPQPFLP